MGLYICDICDAIENTALGPWLAKGRVKWEDARLNDKALCSECCPKVDANGVRRGYCDTPGEWHGRFAKQIASEATVLAMGWQPERPDGLLHLGRFEYLRKRSRYETQNSG